MNTKMTRIKNYMRNTKKQPLSPTNNTLKNPTSKSHRGYKKETRPASHIMPPNRE
jgi:hypothetical protein